MLLTNKKELSNYTLQVHIKEEVFSAVSAVNVDNCFSADYDTYIVRGSYLGSANAYCNIRLRVGGSDDSTSNYERQVFNVSAGSTAFARVTGQNAMVNAIGHQTTGNGALLLEFQRPFNSNPTHAISLSSSQDADIIVAANSTYRFTVGTSFTGFSLICLSGTITGRLDVYAYGRP